MIEPTHDDLYHFEGGPIEVSVEGQYIKITTYSRYNQDNRSQYLFIKFPAEDGQRVIKNIQACLYHIAAMEDETHD